MGRRGRGGTGRATTRGGATGAPAAGAAVVAAGDGGHRRREPGPSPREPGAREAEEARWASPGRRAGRRSPWFERGRPAPAAGPAGGATGIVTDGGV